MRISIVGAGRVAHHLAQVLITQHQIVQVLNRNLQKAKSLAALVNAEAIDSFEQLDSNIDLAIIAVK